MFSEGIDSDHGSGDIRLSLSLASATHGLFYGFVVLFFLWSLNIRVILKPKSVLISNLIDGIVMRYEFYGEI